MTTILKSSGNLADHDGLSPTLRSLSELNPIEEAYGKLLESLLYPFSALVFDCSHLLFVVSYYYYFGGAKRCRFKHATVYTGTYSCVRSLNTKNSTSDEGIPSYIELSTRIENGSKNISLNL